MKQSQPSLEIIAPSIDEAVEQGLAELGLPESEVEIEVLDPGNKGLFGLGFRQARVRLKVKSKPEIGGAAPLEMPAIKTTPVSGESVEKPSITSPMEYIVEKTQEETAPETTVEHPDERTLQVARETVQELLEKMKVNATVTSYYGEPEDSKDKVPLMVDIRGKDLSILIGPKAETLNALQYISSLIIGKEVGHAVPLVVDIEGYRVRRSQQIRQLARRMAEQAVRTGRRQVLEPMPPNERRLVHIELRNNPDVTTESIGEEPRRKVTINPR
jgi:spoIIIJ-associated protein